MPFPIVVIHSMSEHEVVVDDLWVLEGEGLHCTTFFPITSCLLPVVAVIGPIHGHERHDVIQFFHGIDMKGDIVKCPWPGVSITHVDRIPSTTPGAESPRDDRDSGSARSHSTHLETSSSDRPKMVTYTEPQTVSSYISVECTRRTLRMPIFTRATHAQPSLSDFPWRDSDFWRAGTLTRDDPGGTKFSHFPPK